MFHEFASGSICWWIMVFGNIKSIDVNLHRNWIFESKGLFSAIEGIDK